MLRTQGRDDALYDSSIAHLAHLLYTLNAEQCLNGLVAAKSTHILRALTVEETVALIQLIQISYRKLELLRRYIRTKQPNNTSLLASRTQVAQYISNQPNLMHFDSYTMRIEGGSSGDFKEIGIDFSYADMFDSLKFVITELLAHKSNLAPGINLAEY